MNISSKYKINTQELKGKVFLVTGANRGFGYAITKDLARAGATVIMLGRDLGSLEIAYDEILAKGLTEPILYPLDLEGASPEHYQELQQQIKNKFYNLDGLIHNASVIGAMMPIEQYDIKTWYSVLQINVNAAFMLTQFTIPLLKQSKDGRILFISAKQGRKASAYWGAYSASKFAIEGFAKTLAEELETSSVRVNTVDPGKMQTELRRTAYPAENVSNNPKAKSKSPAIVYLMGKNAKNLHGLQLEIV